MSTLVRNKQHSGRLLCVKEAALELDVAPATIRRAIKAGSLPALRLGATGRYRIREADVDALLVPVEPEGGATA